MSDANSAVANYLHSLPLTKYKDGSQFVVFLIGLPGSGKTYVAHKLSEKLDNVFVRSSDHIRRAFHMSDVNGVNPDQALLDELDEKSDEYLYQKHVSHIVDNDIIKYIDLARSTAEKYGITPFFIHIVCAEEVILQRLEQRQKSPASSISTADEKDYFRRKKLHQETDISDDIYFTIDTDGDVGAQLAELADMVKNDLLRRD